MKTPGTYSTKPTKLREILKAPLVAIMDAETLLNKRLVEFIKNYGFTNDLEPIDPQDTDEKLKLIKRRVKLVEFSYQVGKHEKKIKVPVLSLIPIPLLGIEKASFDMQVHLLSMPKTNDNLDEKKTEIMAYLKPTHKSKHKKLDKMSINMQVKMDMAQQDMPGGLAKILGVLNDFSLFNQEEEKENIEQTKID